jgi:DivIVA domain-containing protein
MELSARKIQDQRFTTSLRGYDRTEVDAFLDDAASYVSGLEEQLAIAGRKADKANAELDTLRATIDAELEEARRARAMIIDEARTQAAAMTGATGHGTGFDASRSAAAIIAEAEATAKLRTDEVAQITERARTEADRIVGEAEGIAGRREAEADRVLEAARSEAKQIRAESDRYRREMETHLADVRRILLAAGPEGSNADSAKVILSSGEELAVDLRTDARDRSTAPGTLD